MSAVPSKSERGFDIDALRRDFPALQQSAHGKPLVYLDSAATALKPQCVIDTVAEVYSRDCGNIHRAVHGPAQRATMRFEETREAFSGFLGAEDSSEVIFVRGTTEAINLVAQTHGLANIGAGDEILLTGLEHHSNVVPWQMLCQRVGARLVVSYSNEAGELDLEDWTEKLASDKVKLAAFCHVSNALGTVLPAAEMCRRARERGVVTLVDGAQAAPHLDIDVGALGCDFYALSGHKVYGPSGVGVLYGRRALLDAMPPWQGGGDMIRSVTFEHTEYADAPSKFEAGTPNIAGVIAMGTALKYLGDIDQVALRAHEEDVYRYASAALSELDGLRIVGTASERVGALSFVMKGAHPHDIGTIADLEGVAIRTGHHCAQPVMDHLGVTATARASFGLYNTRADVDALVRALGKVRELFS
jgi:cysteine desulfurase/selenocysteine lyase